MRANLFQTNVRRQSRPGRIRAWSYRLVVLLALAFSLPTRSARAPTNQGVTFAPINCHRLSTANGESLDLMLVLLPVRSAQVHIPGLMLQVVSVPSHRLVDTQHEHV